MPRAKTEKVPRGTSNPIEYLIDGGWIVIDLAKEWGLTSTDAVYRLRRFEYVPRTKTAVRMAATFGWTPGDVINHWLSKVAA